MVQQEPKFWYDEEDGLLYAPDEERPEDCIALYTQQASVVQQEPVGVVGAMPGTSGFTMACFHADKVPVGSKLYLHPSPQQKPNHWVVPEYGFLFPSEEAAKRYLSNIGSDARPIACYTHPAPQQKPRYIFRAGRLD